MAWSMFNSAENVGIRGTGDLGSGIDASGKGGFRYGSDEPEMRQVTRLLALVHNGDTPILGNPQFCVRGEQIHAS